MSNKSNLTPKPSAVAIAPSAPVSAVMPSPPKANKKVAEFSDAVKAISMEAFSDKDLTALFKLIQLEKKERSAKAKEGSLAVGTRVLVEDAKSKVNGKEGVVILARKTRAFVQFEGSLQPHYLAIENLKRVN